MNLLSSFLWDQTSILFEVNKAHNICVLQFLINVDFIVQKLKGTLGHIFVIQLENLDSKWLTLLVSTKLDSGSSASTKRFS